MTDKEGETVKGCRPLTKEEIIKVSEQFSGVFEIRNRALFILGVSVGGRISELLSLKILDVWQNGQPVGDLLFEKNVVKGKKNSRMIPVNSDGKNAIEDLIDWHRKRFSFLSSQRPLFISRNGDKAISRTQAHRVLKDAFSAAGLNGKLATHSLRKTFAQRAYDASGDIFLVKELLGHKSVDTTKQYLGVSYRKMLSTLKEMEIENSNITKISLHSVDDIPTSELIVELASRGIDMRSAIEQRKAERRKAKIVKFKKAT